MHVIHLAQGNASSVSSKKVAKSRRTEDCPGENIREGRRMINQPKIKIAESKRVSGKGKKSQIETDSLQEGMVG